MLPVSWDHSPSVLTGTTESAYPCSVWSVCCCVLPYHNTNPTLSASHGWHSCWGAHVLCSYVCGHVWQEGGGDVCGCFCLVHAASNPPTAPGALWGHHRLSLKWQNMDVYMCCECCECVRACLCVTALPGSLGCGKCGSNIQAEDSLVAVRVVLGSSPTVHILPVGLPQQEADRPLVRDDLYRKKGFLIPSYCFGSRSLLHDINKK